MPITPTQAKEQNKYLYSRKFKVKQIISRIDSCLAENYHILGNIGKSEDNWGRPITSIFVSWADVIGKYREYIAQPENVGLANLIKENIVPLYEAKGWEVHLYYSDGRGENGVWKFEFHIIEECVEGDLSKREKYWINEMNTCERSHGYNKTFGGEFGRLHPDIYKRYSIRLKGGTISEEQKIKISKTLTGRHHPKHVVEKRAKSCRKCNDKIENEMMDLFHSGFQLKEISEMYDMKFTTVVSIRRRYRNKNKKGK